MTNEDDPLYLHGPVDVVSDAKRVVERYEHFANGSGAPEMESVEESEVQPIAILIPAAGSIPTSFFANFVNLTPIERQLTHICRGPYVAQNMRIGVRNLLQVPEWRRLVVIETDMILPIDALVRHALHTDAVVGSMYFQHAPPYWANVMMRHPNRSDMFAQLSPVGVREMLRRPGLYECDIVGMGCTSIRRDVLENWPDELPHFRTEYTHAGARELNDDAMGEISHDVWFCQRAREQGHRIYVDSGVVCKHLTEGWTEAKHHFLHHKAALETATARDRVIHMPNGRTRRVGAV